MDRPQPEVKLIFGKYAGREIYQVPSSYLKYIATEWSEGTKYEKQVVVEADKEWRWREENNQHFEEGDEEDWSWAKE